jgi:hypothetical protein
MTGPERGTYLFSRTVHHADSEDLPVGGAVIDYWPDLASGELMVKVVGVHRGAPVYHTLACSDTVPGMSGEVIRTDVIRDLLLALNTDEVRHKDPLRHLSAKNVLAGVLQAHEPAGRAHG